MFFSCFFIADINKIDKLSSCRYKDDLILINHTFHPIEDYPNLQKIFAQYDNLIKKKDNLPFDLCFIFILIYYLHH